MTDPHRTPSVAFRWRLTAGLCESYDARMEGHVRYWIALAERDIASAEVLLESGDTANALMLCQQSLEKALKAHIQRGSAQPPPRVHSLLRLLNMAELAGELSAHMAQTLAEVDPYIIEARYASPSQDPLKSAPSAQVARDLLARRRCCSGSFKS